MKGRLLFILLLFLSIQNTSAYAIQGSYTSNSNVVVEYETFEGKYLFLEFLQTDCPACVNMHIVISDLHATYNSRVSFLSLVYSAADTIPVLQDFVEDHPTSWNIGRDPDIAFFMRIQVTPTMMVLDKSGNELNRWEGSQSYNTLAASLDQLPLDDDVSVTSLTNTGYIEPYEENKTLIEIITESPITQAVVIIFIVVLIYKKSISPKS